MRYLTSGDVYQQHREKTVALILLLRLSEAQYKLSDISRVGRKEFLTLYFVSLCQKWSIDFEVILLFILILLDFIFNIFRRVYRGK